MKIIRRTTTHITETVKFEVSFEEFEREVMDSHPLSEYHNLKAFAEKKLNRIEVQVCEFEIDGEVVKISAEFLEKYDVETVTEEI